MLESREALGSNLGRLYRKKGVPSSSLQVDRAGLRPSFRYLEHFRTKLTAVPVAVYPTAKRSPIAYPQSQVWTWEPFPEHQEGIN